MFGSIEAQICHHRSTIRVNILKEAPLHILIFYHIRRLVGDSLSWPVLVVPLTITNAFEAVIIQCINVELE